MILVVLTTILSILGLRPMQKVNAQGPVDFDYPFFDASSANSLNFLYNATMDTVQHVIKVTDPSDNWCDSHVCRGQIIYSTAIDFVDRNLKRTYSFSTSFVFSLTVPGNIRSGEGFVFFIISNPYDSQGNGIGDYFGAFPSHGQTSVPTIAVEFDTLKNAEVYDVDDNHVGIDINKAISAVQQSCYPLNINLYEGQKIKVWIEYHDSIKMFEVRLAFWTSSVVRPTNPFMELNVDLATLVDNKMYVGFSGESYNGQEQESGIYSWSFHSKLEAQSPPPPPRAPTNGLGSNGSGSASAPSPLTGNNSTRNHTRSKEEGIIMGFCVGGGLGLILIVACCFWFGYYCSKKAAKAAEEADRRKKSETAGYAADAEEDERMKKYQGEGDIDSGDVEAGVFGVSIFGPLLSRARSFKLLPEDNIDDPKFTALRRGSYEELVPKRVKSARELEAEGVQADAIKKGMLDIHGVHPPYRRKPQSFGTFDARESVDAAAKRRQSWRSSSAVATGRELAHLREEETGFELRAPALPEQRSSGVPPVVAASEEGGEILSELPVTQLTAEKEVVPLAAASPSKTSSGRGDDADSGTSDIVYQISAKPSVSIENAARRSKSWSLWSSEQGAPPHNRRHSSPVASVQVKRTKTWGPLSSTQTREVEVVVKRSEAIRPRKPEGISLERIPDSSATRSREVERIPHESPERTTSTPKGTIMFTNTLYDSPPEESHDPSPPQPDDDFYMDDNIYVRPTPENIHDRPPVATDYGEEIVERIFDVEITKDDYDVDRIFDVPDSADVPHREITITSITPSPVHTPAQSRGGSRLPSRAATPSPNRKTSPAGTTTPSTAETSGSSSTGTSKDSEQRRVKARPHWRY